MTPSMRSAFLVFLATAVAGLGAAAWLGHAVWVYPDTPSGAATGAVVVDVPKGAGATQVAELLNGVGLIDNPTFFRLYSTQRRAASRFKAGHYQIAAPATPRQLLELIVKGVADETMAVTLPEGKNVVEIAEILDAAGITSKMDLLARAGDAEFVKSLDLPGPTLEGYLFPDTYKLRPHMAADKVIMTLVRRHRQVAGELRAARALGVALLQRALGEGDARMVTLASMVEKETGSPEERPRIAQVFLNRMLKPSFRPKLLQTDPTIVYGCTAAPLLGGKISAACKQWDGRIHRIHLEDADNPYNTYTHEGLPPGPIANPGRAALAAVLNPDGTPYLYFVAKNDGTHKFSATVAEHEAAVTQYQRGGKPMAKSTP